jgi:hypothetical protein
MKQAACFLLVCAAAYGQTPAGNAAGDAIQKRIQGINLLSARRPVYPPNAIASRPFVCAIPLLRTPGPGTQDKIPVMTPKMKPSAGDLVQVPAPACDEATFTNK